MKTWCGAGAPLLGALILAGCAASSVQGAPVRVHTTSAAFEHSAPSETAFASRSTAKGGSPVARECKGGSSKACNEIGDRLAIKHAYSEATQWYLTSCERVRGAMVPAAQRLLQAGQDAAAKREVPELRARIQGCFDAGEMMRAEGELKQSVPYYDAVCEFSTLVETLGESVLGLEHLADNGCAATQSTREKLHQSALTPALFVDVLKQHAAAQESAGQGDDMVFTTDETQ